MKIHLTQKKQSFSGVDEDPFVLQEINFYFIRVDAHSFNPEKQSFFGVDEHSFTLEDINFYFI